MIQDYDQTNQLTNVHDLSNVHGLALTALAFSADGNSLASSSLDKTIKISEFINLDECVKEK